MYQITQIDNLDKGGSLQEGKVPNVDASFRDNEIWMKVGQPFWEGTSLRKAPNVDANFRDHDNSTKVGVWCWVMCASTLFHIEFIQAFCLSTCVVFNQ